MFYYLVLNALGRFPLQNCEVTPQQFNERKIRGRFAVRDRDPLEDTPIAG